MVHDIKNEFTQGYLLVEKRTEKLLIIKMNFGKMESILSRALRREGRE
jgi:hypothetical protein